MNQTPPVIVIAIDALEYEKVLEFNCKNLMQDFYGKTDISEFSDARTMVLWSSFMTGENKEEEILIDGDKEMWSKKWDLSDTFFSKFKSPVVLDLPGYSYDLKVHEKSRKLLKNYFQTDDEARKIAIVAEYNNDALEHHNEVKSKFYIDLYGDHDFILAYFSVIDVIGHLRFGQNVLMRLLYANVDEMCANIKKNQPESRIIVLSDHGMKAVGRFGDHSSYGFWSTNWKDLGSPRITEIAGLIDGRN